MTAKTRRYLRQTVISTLVFYALFSCKKDTTEPMEDADEVISGSESDPIVPKLVSLSPDTAALNATQPL